MRPPSLQSNPHSKETNANQRRSETSARPHSVERDQPCHAAGNFRSGGLAPRRVEPRQRRAQAALSAQLYSAAKATASGMATSRSRPDEVIDTTWEELPDENGKPPSGWTRH